jgi:hypothetical protein
VDAASSLGEYFDVFSSFGDDFEPDFTDDPALPTDIVSAPSGDAAARSSFRDLAAAVDE